ncbi:MAG: hypothetical protein HC890_05860 [Chloroflexaceae bacterium]|nr:hypothetical protein [Chloroflexaceae bacterium]
MQLRSILTILLASLALTSMTPAAAQFERSRSNSRGGSHLDSTLTTDGQGNATRQRQQTFTGSQGRTTTCSSTTTVNRGQGVSYDGSCNPSGQ